MVLRAGLTVSPTDWLMLFGSYAQAFRAPTMGEMYNDAKHFSIGRFYTNYWVPNPICARNQRNAGVWFWSAL